MERIYINQSETNENSIVQIVDSVLHNAILNHASDIHIEPFVDKINIRFRMDGLLNNIIELNKNLLLGIASRLKVMASLDISEKRLPQDGHFNFIFHHKIIDCRISTIATIYGEKIVIRLLNKNNLTLKIDSLGFHQEQLTILKNILIKPQGLILITGPTGSGKTSTLYSIIKELSSDTKNIITIEDPVEMKLNGINQISVNKKIGLTFASLLRSILRQDPDIIMIGEVRDKETAETAIEAAQTGHLVLATVHSNNTVETLMRFHAMKISSYNLANSLNIIISQRLVRKICELCNGNYTKFKCNKCNNGFKGRIGIFELLEINKKIRSLIYANKDPETILDLAKQEGMLMLKQSGLKLVTNNITLDSEILRVI